MKTYLNDLHIFTRSMTEIFSKCISTLRVIFKLPNKLAQAVLILICTRRSSFRIPLWTLIILKPNQSSDLLISSVIFFHRRQDTLDEWSARRMTTT
jgi:hypothetical protein